MGFLFISVGPIIWFVFLGQYVAPWTQFGHCCYFMYFLQIQWHFLNSKWGGWVHLHWVRCVGINSCY